MMNQGLAFFIYFLYMFIKYLTFCDVFIFGDWQHHVVFNNYKNKFNNYQCFKDKIRNDIFLQKAHKKLFKV